jgi:hypothetical protein
MAGRRGLPGRRGRGAGRRRPGGRVPARAGPARITLGGAPLAVYSFGDATIPRPYFAHVHAPGGIAVTRNHPPIAGTDPTDHAAFHPGLWLAFGDLGGADSWRNRARVEHEEFVGPPTGGAGRGTFAVRNRYRSATGMRTSAARSAATRSSPGRPGRC